MKNKKSPKSNGFCIWLTDILFASGEGLPETKVSGTIRHYVQDGKRYISFSYSKNFLVNGDILNGPNFSIRLEKYGFKVENKPALGNRIHSAPEDWFPC